MQKSEGSQCRFRLLILTEPKSLQELTGKKVQLMLITKRLTNNIYNIKNIFEKNVFIYSHQLSLVWYLSQYVFT